MITLAAVILATVVFRGILGRLSIVLGVVVGYVVAVLPARSTTPRSPRPAGSACRSSPRRSVAWSLLPAFLPVVLVLVAENVGHVRGVAHMTDPAQQLTGRALLADGLATTLAGLGGGSGTTTYGENIGVMAATKVYSTAAYWVAGAFAVLLGLCPRSARSSTPSPPACWAG